MRGLSGTHHSLDRSGTLVRETFVFLGTEGRVGLDQSVHLVPVVRSPVRDPVHAPLARAPALAVRVTGG